MSRILLTWELGLNLGHLARLLPIAKKLKERGHTVLVAVRDISSASSLLGPAGIAFVQAPHLPQGIPLPHRSTGYADILLSQGWADRSTLWGLTHGWLNLYRMFRPEILLMDYSPTATLAARIAEIPRILIGNGFELPPETSPLPPFPGFSWATPERAKQAEQLAVTNANAVAHSYKASSFKALRQLFEDATLLFATFPELDHYGARPSARYIGPLLGGLRTELVDWPETVTGKRIFACLRPDTEHVDTVLGALKASGVSVVCFAPGFSQDRLEAFRSPHIHFTSKPVDLNHLGNADACVSYGAEGTVISYLLRGVPQLIVPKQVEAYMAARCVERIGAGLTLTPSQSVEGVAKMIERLTNEPQFAKSAQAFHERCAKFNKDMPINEVVKVSEEKMQCGMQKEETAFKT